VDVAAGDAALEGEIRARQAWTGAGEDLAASQTRRFSSSFVMRLSWPEVLSLGSS
jgi:hypothetical protein